MSYLIEITGLLTKSEQNPMAKNIFEIKSAYCSYDKTVEGSVLFIDELSIEKGEIVFLLGSSGSGKSTLLETLGLMNNTLVSGEIKFHPKDDKEISYKNLWDEKNTNELSNVRRSYLSFIFQNTNLMDNFTAYENICLSAMIQKGESQSEAMEGAKRLMDAVGLPIQQISESTLASNLSGGQRQRVAFVRALNSGFSVLFGDEPTGNLDEKNANALIQIIKDNLNENAAAIIVSHDINLAVNHASRIICLSKSKTSKHAEILKENIFERKDWQNLNIENSQKFKDKIKALYAIDIDKKVSNVQDESVDIKTKYRKLFLNKEGRSLIGKGYSNLLALIAILSITLLAIGFANGSLAYLNNKLSDPFVNWLKMTIPYQRVTEIPKYLDELNTPEMKKNYAVKSVLSYKEQSLEFQNKSDNTFQYKEGRSVQYREGGEDVMMKDILKDENRMTGDKKGFTSQKDLGIVVTSRFLASLGYPMDAPFVYMGNRYVDSNGTKMTVPVPIAIRAVVKDIPGKMDFVYSEHFLRAYYDINNGPFDIWKKKGIKVILIDNQQNANVFQKAATHFFDTHKEYEKYDFQAYQPIKNNETWQPSYEISIRTTTRIPMAELNLIYQKLMESPEIKPMAAKAFQYYQYDDYNDDYSHALTFDIVSINFEKIDSVRKFSEMIKHKYNSQENLNSGSILEVDMASVREKENFLFLSNIAKIISSLVLIFGLLSVILFISNLLKTHLSKIKMNIGTYKAFGLGDKEAQGIYFIIIFRFILTSLFVAFAFSFGAGFIIDVLLKKFITIEGNNTFFKLIDPFTYFSIVIIIGSGILVSWVTINKMLNKTPGDLIFNRQ